MTRLIRFTQPNSRRSYFVNEFMVRNLGKTRRELAEAVHNWPEKVETAKHGPMTLQELLSMSGQTFDDLLYWVTDDFEFFSWDDRGRLTLKPRNLEICLLLDRLITAGVPMGKNNGSQPDTILWAWKQDDGLEGLRRLADKTGILP